SAVNVPEIEESLADNRADLIAGRQRRGANRADLAVGEEERFAVGGDAARLRQRGVGERPVNVIFAPAARVGSRFTRLQIDDRQLMWAGHRYVKFSVARERVPRRIERYGPSHAGDVELARLLSRADQRLHHAGFQIGAADQMVLGVADVKRI